MELHNTEVSRNSYLEINSGDLVGLLAEGKVIS